MPAKTGTKSRQRTSSKSRSLIDPHSIASSAQPCPVPNGPFLVLYSVVNGTTYFNLLKKSTVTLTTLHQWERNKTKRSKSSLIIARQLAVNCFLLRRLRYLPASRDHVLAGQSATGFTGFLKEICSTFRCGDLGPARNTLQGNTIRRRPSGQAKSRNLPHGREFREKSRCICRACPF